MCWCGRLFACCTFRPFQQYKDAAEIDGREWTKVKKACTFFPMGKFDGFRTYEGGIAD
jgi:hypothetical protein